MSRQPGRGAIVWLTGMSGAGKSTVAQALKARLERGHAVEILDGDEVREHLSKGLTFSKEDRDINVRRIGFVARLLAKHGVIAITAAISPYEATRTEVRRAAERDGVTFVEVYANAELQTLVDRDVKGLYKQALAGNLPHFTGVSDPYEPPPNPEVVVRSDRETVEVSVARVLGWLIDRGLIDRGALIDRSSSQPQSSRKRQSDHERRITPIGYAAASFFPVFLRLAGRRVLLVGAGPVGASKLQGLLDAGALITVVAPDIVPDIEQAALNHAAAITLKKRPFEVSDLDGVWYVVAAATPAVNRAVALAAEERQLFVNAVDDPPNATAYLGGVLRRGGVTVAISTDGHAPALAGLLREGLDALLPHELVRMARRGARRPPEVAGRWGADGRAAAAAAEDVERDLRPQGDGKES